MQRLIEERADLTGVDVQLVAAALAGLPTLSHNAAAGASAAPPRPERQAFGRVDRKSQTRPGSTPIGPAVTASGRGRAASAGGWPRTLTSMRLYGIASGISDDIDDLHATQEAADAVLRTILSDAPELAGELCVEPVELEDPSHS